MATNPFADLIPSTTPGVIMGPPKIEAPKTTYKTLTPEEVSAHGLPAGAYQMDSNGKIDKLADLPKGDDSLQAAIKGLGIQELLTGVGRARKLVGTGWATGLSGTAGGIIPGSTRNDFLGTLDQIQGGIIMEKLQALKDASKTGASGMGALSEREGARMAASVSALSPNMSAKALQTSLDDIERHAKTLQAIADGKDPRDAAVAKQYGIPPIESGGTAADDSLVKGMRLTADQEKEWGEFLKTRPGPQQILDKLASWNLSAANAAEVGAAAKEGRINTGIDYSKLDAAAEAAARKEADRVNAQEGGPGVKDLITQGMTLGLSDEAAGVGRGLSYALTGKNPLAGYRLGRDAERLRIEDVRQQLGYAAAPVEIASGFLSANPASALAPFAGARHLVGQGAKQGAAGGALAGFGYGEGTEGSVGGAALGAATGGALGGVVSAASSRYAPRGMDPALAAASKAEGVDLMKPMVDPNLVSDYGALESNVYSQPIIRGAAARIRGQIEDRVQALGADGAELTAESAGERIQGAANRFITRSKGVASRLYDRARSLAGDTKIDPQNAIKQADAEIADLSQNPDTNAAEIRFIQGVRNDLASPGGKTTDALRGIRTSIRGSINEAGLTATQAEARVGRILNAAHADLAASLPEGAATAFQRADTFYRERMVHVDDVLKKFLGPRDAQVSGEQAFARLKSIASPGGDGRRLAALMRDMEPSERQDVAATIAQSLGRRSPDEPFSTALFLSQTRKLSPSARRTIFGPDGAQSIDNLRLLSRKLEEAGKDINHSRSATVLERQGWRNAARTFIAAIAGIGGQAASGSIAGGVAGVGVAATAMGASATRRVLSARAMVNPKVSLWLAQAVDISTPAAAQTHIRRLGTIAAREPAIAGEINQLQQSLSKALLPAPASGDDEEAQ